MTTIATADAQTPRGEKHIYRFEEGSAEMRDLLGGKGANLCEMSRLGLPVPPGFVITTATCREYYDRGRSLPDAFWDELRGYFFAHESLERAKLDMERVHLNDFDLDIRHKIDVEGVRLQVEEAKNLALMDLPMKIDVPKIDVELKVGERIPGFGIGRPVRQPELDVGVTPPALATPEEAAAIERTWDLEPDLLVIAAAPDAPLLIAGGAPEEVVAREHGRFLVGLLGAVLAIGSAVAGAVVLAVR